MITTTQFNSIAGWEERLLRLSDRCNPLAVREIRQALKTRAFMTVFSLLLLGSWSYSVLGVISHYKAMEYTEIGSEFFHIYLLALIVCLLFAIPCSTFFSMAQEFHDRAFEMLAVTTLSPSQIVTGKLQSSLVMMIVYASAIAPFICLSYMLGGLGLIEIIISLTGLMLVSLGLSMFAVMMGALCQKPWLEVLNLVILLIVALVTASITYAVLGSLTATHSASLMEAIIGMSCFVIFLLFVSLISLGVAQAQLTTTFLPMGYRHNPGGVTIQISHSHPNALVPQPIPDLPPNDSDDHMSLEELST